MPELFAVITTAAHVVGYAVLLILLAAIVMPVLAGVLIALWYSGMVIYALFCEMKCMRKRRIANSLGRSLLCKGWGHEKI